MKTEIALCCIVALPTADKRLASEKHCIRLVFRQISRRTRSKVLSWPKVRNNTLHIWLDLATGRWGLLAGTKKYFTYTYGKIAHEDKNRGVRGALLTAQVSFGFLIHINLQDRID